MKDEQAGAFLGWEVRGGVGRNRVQWGDSDDRKVTEPMTGLVHGHG